MVEYDSSHFEVVLLAVSCRRQQEGRIECSEEALMNSSVCGTSQNAIGLNHEMHNDRSDSRFWPPRPLWPSRALTVPSSGDTGVEGLENPPHQVFLEARVDKGHLLNLYAPWFHLRRSCWNLGLGTLQLDRVLAEVDETSAHDAPPSPWPSWKRGCHGCP